MQSKIKSPKQLADLTAVDYKMKLKADLTKAKTAKKPPNFLLHINHQFADGNRGPLLICGTGTPWKKYIKDIVKGDEKTFVITGNCSLNEANELTLIVEKGKAKKDKIIKSFKKNPLLKKLTLGFEGAVEATEMTAQETIVHDRFDNEFHQLYQESIENKTKKELKAQKEALASFLEDKLLGPVGELFATSIQGDEKASAKFQKIKTKVSEKIDQITQRLEKGLYAAVSDVQSTTDFIEDTGKLKESGSMGAVVKSLQALKATDENGLSLNYKIQQATPAKKEELLRDKQTQLETIQKNALKWLKKHKKGGLLENKKQKAQRLKQHQAMQKLLQQIQKELVNVEFNKKINLPQKALTEGLNRSQESHAKKEANDFKKLISNAPNYHANNTILQNKELLQQTLKDSKDENGIALYSEEAIQLKLLEYTTAEKLQASNGKFDSLEEHKEVTLELIKARIDTQMAEGVTNLAQAFRGNDIVSATVSAYINHYNAPFNQSILQKMDTLLMDQQEATGTYEIDPAKLETVGKIDMLDDNIQKLSNLYRKILSVAIGPKAIKNIAPEVKEYCKEIYETAGGDNNLEAAQKVVIGFLYLRVVNPLFMNLRGQLDMGSPADRAAVYIAKLLQNQANKTKATETYMKPFDPLLEEFSALTTSTITAIVK
ncbi:RasGAP domain-containing protein [Aureispira anguillae]|uniref:RasGAP domain-containing protein n=1 Tax=Aureispira anguillae TaxID=2864201 RepID=A0A915YJM0_9BACT|nr:RasGAP domain-containing protein [Aureispira anguillae]BDS14413.1 RasGAP domain-containing protein [Aureispira anguillae]